MGPAPWTTPTFPSRYPSPLVADAKLQAALDAAIAAGPGTGWRSPVAFASLGGTAGHHPVASFRGGELHYSASLVKVAAMYSAFELRGRLRALAQEVGAAIAPSAFLARAAAHFNPKILVKARAISALQGVQPANALPAYGSTFQASAGGPGVAVDFTGAFGQHLNGMISVSNNNDAAACVHGSGYGYLNGTLEEAGFFDPVAHSGLWLAGDYIGQYPYFRVPSVNDGPIAQGASVLSLVALYTLLADRTLVDTASSDDMLQLLTTPVAVPEVFINRASPINFTVTHTKVGLGPLKTGPLVSSEASILRHNTGARFVIAWQNYREDDNFDTIARIAVRTMDKFLSP